GFMMDQAHAPGFMMNPGQAGAAAAPGFMMNQGQVAAAGAAGAGAYKYRTLKISPAEVHQVQSALFAWGVSYQGAHQLATSQAVINAGDRQAITSIMYHLLKIVARKHDTYK